MSAADIPFSEAEAARRLGISKATLMRARAASLIHPMRHGPRTIRYTQSILDEYQEQCRNAPAKSENTGSASARGRTSGAERGSTPPPDKHDALHLAQQIFKKAS